MDEDSVTPSRPLIKMLNSRGPRQNPLSSRLTELINYCSLSPIIQLVYLCLCSSIQIFMAQLEYEKSINVKNLALVQVHDTIAFPPPNHFLPDHQPSQMWFTPSKLMLTDPNHLHTARNRLHDLPRDQARWISLERFLLQSIFVILEHGCNICLSLVTGELSRSQWLHRDYRCLPLQGHWPTHSTFMCSPPCPIGPWMKLSPVSPASCIATARFFSNSLPRCRGLTGLVEENCSNVSA